MVGYSCSVWLYSTNLFKLITAGKLHIDTNNSLKRIAADSIERVHLKLLKWTIGLKSRSSNLACWGDSGRVPMTIRLLKQTFDYYQRLELLDANDSESLVRHAFVEQREQLLPWFSGTLNFIDNIGLTKQASPTDIQEATKYVFKDLWHSAIKKIH